jgi:restriction endonuclease S subunit
MVIGMALLKCLTVDGRGSYGIAASAVERNERLYTYLRITDIRDDGTLNMNDLKSVDDPNASKYILHPNDIVFARTGASTGRNYFYDGSDGTFVYAGFLIKFSLDPQKVNPVYIKYYCQSTQYRNWIKSFSTGSTRGNINAQTLGNMDIPLPSREQQDFIVRVLSPIDEKIKLNQKINDNLYEMVNAYYTSLFKENDCEMTTVGNYAERIYSGGTPMTSNAAYWNGTFGWFSSGETRNRFVISTEKTITQSGIDNSSTKLATKYDIVMASAGQGFTRGQTSMLLIDTYVNQSVIVIKSERNILPYLFWNLANRYDELRAISDSSSIRGSLTTKMIAAFEIPLANEQSLQAFADFAWSVIPQIENNLLENERLTALRDSLLPKLMSGEIDVSDVSI